MCYLANANKQFALPAKIFQLTFFALDNKHLCRCRKESFNE